MDGRPLAFYQVAPEGDGPIEFMDADTGSRWNMRGEAIAGPFRGRKLEQVPAYNAMWFAWLSFWPHTEVWRGEGIFDMLTAVAEEPAAPVPIAPFLTQNYPNPFNPITRIPYRLAATDRLRLRILNAAGQRVRTLVDGERRAGFHQVAWDGRDGRDRDLASGLYLYRPEAERSGFSQTRAMLLAR